MMHLVHLSGYNFLSSNRKQKDVGEVIKGISTLTEKLLYSYLKYDILSSLNTADAHPTLKMEDKLTVSSSGTQDNPIMKSVDQRTRTRGRNDIMTRRLKNRERQRRYRARKRLEAESKKSSVMRETPLIEAEPKLERQLQPNVNHHNFVARIYCKRDWKKDARQAHSRKHQEVTTPNGYVDPPRTLPGESEAACLVSVNRAEPTFERKIQYESSPSVVNSEVPRIVQSGRDWKADARRKKN